MTGPDPLQSPSPAGGGLDAAVLVAFARLEAKVDVALAQHGARIEAHASDIADHERRIRSVEARPLAPDLSGLDHRVRSLESRPTVSPRTLWAVVMGLVAALGTLGPVIARLFT